MSMKLKIAIVVVASCIRLSSANAAVEYTITDLGTLGGAYSGAGDINNAGQVVGESTISSTGPAHAFLYSNGAMQDLGTLGGDNSQAWAINDSGQVVGLSDTAQPMNPPLQHAFVDNGSGMQDLTPLSQYYSVAHDINNQGAIVGAMTLDPSTGHAFVYAGGTLTDLGALGGTSSEAWGINNNGVIVGDIAVDGTNHAIAYSNGTVQDLSSLLGSGYSVAAAVNNAGQITGVYSGGVFLITAGTLQDLGMSKGGPTFGLGINAAGVVVGEAEPNDPTNHQSWAVVSQGGQMVDLNTLIDPAAGWQLFDATGINDAGQIVGTGSINGQTHAFVLTPVPEPATGLLALLGLAGWWGLRKRA